MEKLQDTIQVESDLGPIQATHVRRNVQLIEGGDGGGDRIISTRTLALETANGIKDIPGTAESIDIVGDDLGGLGHSDFLSMIGKKHDEVKARIDQMNADALSARAKVLQEQIAAAQAELGKLQPAK